MFRSFKLKTTPKMQLLKLFNKKQISQHKFSKMTLKQELVLWFQTRIVIQRPLFQNINKRVARESKELTRVKNKREDIWSRHEIQNFLDTNKTQQISTIISILNSDKVPPPQLIIKNRKCYITNLEKKGYNSSSIIILA